MQTPSAVSRHGEEAIKQLKEQGSYESLAAAITAATYSIKAASNKATAGDGAAYEGVNPAQALRTRFTTKEVRVSLTGARQWETGVRLKGYGYGKNVIGLTTREIKAEGNRIEIAKQETSRAQSTVLTEWYVNTRNGLEQGFTLFAPPEQAVGGEPRDGNLATTDRLRISLELIGDLHGEATEDGHAIVLKDKDGQAISSYDHLKAWDATGRELPARMRVRGSEVSLEVDDTGAKYPVTIDPTFGQKQFLLKADDGKKQDAFGYSVAISGNTAVVGAVGVGNASRGYAYVFGWNGTTWAQQKKLKDDAGMASDFFGKSVGISGDTIIIGAVGVDLSPGIDPNDGAAYVYTRSGSTWSLSQVLTASDAHAGAGFGNSVAIDGDTAVVGSSSGAYVFARITGKWSEQRTLFPDNGGNNPTAFPVAISGDTVMFRGSEPAKPGQTYAQGAMYFVRRTGATWLHPLQQQKVLAGDYIDGDVLGNSVAISGGTAIAGYAHISPDQALESSRQGAYVFARNEGTWSQQEKLAPGDPQTASGSGHPSVGLSGDTAIVGFPDETIDGKQGQGSAYIYVRTASAWSKPEKLTASGGVAGDYFGGSVALSGDNAIVGAEKDDVAVNSDQGSAYLFARPPDTDGDGLPDEWEKKGITVANSGQITVGKVSGGMFIDLPHMGANPMHKDIFVHVDWMGPDPNRRKVVFKPDPRAIKMVIDAFAIAPAEQVKNPDHKRGINLHVDLGPNSIMKPGAVWGTTYSRAGEVAYQASTGTLGSPPDFPYQWSAVNAAKDIFFTTSGRSPVFHYALFCNSYPSSPPQSSGLSRDIPGSDFIVTLGQIGGGSIEQQAGTFMHEFGHNLGLHHGGIDDIHNKPNYLSIMNYTFQMAGLLNANGKRSFDYSRAKLKDLDEFGLNEDVGINDPAMHRTLWDRFTHPNPQGSNQCLNHDNYYKVFPSRALDWDCNGVRSPAPYPSPSPNPDINGDGTCVTAGGSSLNSVPKGDDELRPSFIFDRQLRRFVVSSTNLRIVAGPNHICESLAGTGDKQTMNVNTLEPNLLRGFNDWPALIFTGSGNIGSSAGAMAADQMETPANERSIDEILSMVPQALIDEELVAPLDVAAVSPGEGAAPLQVSFDGSGSTAVSGTIVSWEWDFGDGTTGSGATVKHTYNTPGDYFASHNVTDSEGRVNLVPLLNLITVTGGPSPTPTPTSTPTNQPNLVPYQPDGWSDKIVVSKAPGTNVDSIPLKATDTLYVDWAAINGGGAPASGGFSNQLYVDGVEKQTVPISPTIDPDGFFGVQDYAIGSLSPGQHTVRIVLDDNGEIAESNEADNEYTKTISVASLTPTPTPTPGVTPKPTPTPTPSASPTPTPSGTPSPTATPTGPLPGRRITKVADNTLAELHPLGSLHVTSINNNRTLLFYASRPNTEPGLFTKTAGGPLQSVADFTSIGGPPWGNPTINESGQVGFMTRPGETGFPDRSDTFRIYRSDAGVLTKLAETTNSGPAGTFATFDTTTVSINDSGTVSFWAELNRGPGTSPGGMAISRVDNGGTLSTAVDTNNGFFTSLYEDARMNQSGVIAFQASTTTGLGIFTVAPDGTLTTIVTRPSEFEGFGDPSINNAGTVAFAGSTKTINGVFTGKGGALTTIAQASRDASGTDPFLDFGSILAINDAGTVVFRARLRSAPENAGFYTGPTFRLGKIDPLAVDKIIAIGDSLFGSTVENLYFPVLNQNGDIAFSYELKNRARGVAFASPLPTQLANISTRLRVQTGDNALIGGFIITGTEPKKVLLRAIAPSLNVPGKLADPTLELYNSSGHVIRMNNNWGDSENKQAIIASTIPPGHNLESAILVNLDPGAYTAIVRGVNNTIGNGVVEAYDLDRTADSKFANISTRGVVETGDDVMIGGFIIVGSKQQKVIVRAIGPSLSIAQKLLNPTLELRDQNGALLEANDNWVDSPNKKAIVDSTIPPSNNLESAIVRTLSPAAYTAIVRGVNNTTGIAVVEVYALQ